MEQIYILAAIWLGLAVLSTVIAYHLKISIALIEICVGMGAAFVTDRFLGHGVLGGEQEWLRFLASAGAVLLTFLAGAELDPKVLSSKKKEVIVVGLVGFLAPFYFLRARTLVSLPALLTAPVVFCALFAGKVVSKIFGLRPVIGLFSKERSERWYYTLMMSTGLTFGTISALYGLSHGIVNQTQYSFLVAAVIASAVIPTFAANLSFMPHHLLPQKLAEGMDEE